MVHRHPLYSGVPNYSPVDAEDPDLQRYPRFRGAPLKVHAALPLSELTNLPPGSILSGAPFRVACGGGTVLAINEVQQEGRKRVPSESFLNGQHLADNESLT